MGSIGRWILTIAVGLLLAAGIPQLATTAAHAGPGCDECECPCKGCECPCGGKADCGHCEECGGGGPCGKHGAMHGKDGKHPHGKHMGGGPPMKEGMSRHLEETRGTIGKLRAVEARMEASKAKDDAAAFRAASLEHAKLLTDLQESHLKHMDWMMRGK